MVVEDMEQTTVNGNHQACPQEGHHHQDTILQCSIIPQGQDMEVMVLHLDFPALHQDPIDIRIKDIMALHLELTHTVISSTHHMLVVIGPLNIPHLL